MIDLLNFAFSGFWTFIGCAILLSIATGPFYAFSGALAALLGRR